MCEHMSDMFKLAKILMLFCQFPKPSQSAVCCTANQAESVKNSFEFQSLFVLITIGCSPNTDQ